MAAAPSRLLSSLRGQPAAGSGVARGGEGGRDGAACVIGDVVEVRCVGVEVAGLREAFEVGGGMDEVERGVGDGVGSGREAKLPGGASGAEERGSANDAGGLLGAHR
jgi:hypothetical protein